MSVFPSLPLFTDAFIADTGHLSLEQRGAYLMLLQYAWRSPGCRLPDDDAKIARMLSISASRWAKLKIEVMAFWTLADGFWTQKRLQREYHFVTEKVAKKRAAGEQGGRPKSLPDNDQGKALGSENEKQTESKPKAPTPTPTPKESPKAPKGAEHEGFASFWAEYPKRDGENPRAPAVAKYAWAIREGATAGSLLAAVRVYRATSERQDRIGTRFVKQTRFWLSDRPWEDLRPSSSAAASAAADGFLDNLPDDRWRGYVRQWNRGLGDWDLKSRTPPPDHPRTKVPRHILAEFGLAPIERAVEDMLTGTG